MAAAVDPLQKLLDADVEEWLAIINSTPPDTLRATRFKSKYTFLDVAVYKHLEARRKGLVQLMSSSFDGNDKDVLARAGRFYVVIKALTELGVLAAEEVV
jgi:hypothetical protein